MNPVFFGQVKHGKLKLDKQAKFNEYLVSLNGVVKLVLGRWSDKEKRSLAQNNYYHGVIVKLVANEMGFLVPDDAHNYLRSLFLKKGVDANGKRYEIIGSTTALNPQEFEEYTEKCRLWAAQELNLVIPLPNEVEP